jgi:hypothetical protein
MTFNQALKLMLKGQLCKRPATIHSTAHIVAFYEYGFPDHANGVLMKRNPHHPNVWWVAQLKRPDYEATDWELSNGTAKTSDVS